ncbi:Glycosyl hydrolase [Trema orientale]|uniref:Glycosyl hydrolase n=1 Tax=Trema orientale TaxID=63057 RepID=A0A2P5EI85_TREOI|nr:Glycosyl hydrolase [Trema orientale]
MVTPASHEAAFIGATSETSSSRIVFSLGVLRGFKFLCLFRFKMWWMIPSFGGLGCDVPAETQMLLLEAREDTIVPDGNSEQKDSMTFYIPVLPLLEGKFRGSLQGTVVNKLELCVESRWFRL